MNALNGFNSNDDDLPDRFFTDPGSSTNHIHIPPINRDAFLAARKKYYNIRGLTFNGMPLKNKAQTLGLLWNNL